ncbi:MAG: hypothetical protein OEV49_03650 [candidate division Zixibacteria bacterium]|nr:hypothetical protein [candidate division Zixibacteria bacterium]MDH3939187.1 hypothetical protein [candidate division Zixibacteria bacterium]MDH4034544.1 hypothetical protein [candidate division Zixibacteria bacterium]
MFKCITVLILTLMFSSQVSAEIMLKKSLLSGWKYSVDGGEYQKVGMSGGDLRYELGGNDEAMAYMDKYESANTWAAVTGIPGGFLVGWPLGGYIGSGGEWKDSYTTMVAIGAPLSIISMVLESSAGRNLKKAVGLHNDAETQSLGLKLNLQPHTEGLLLSLKYEF